ncbi:MAG: carboxypeptidase regulatory-like domain-containing protein, partial [Planctomycetes bacterium]|nr:carboxypeptidase regulatory-like domain-containing protein [Planctomycetota bacterium]
MNNTVAAALIALVIGLGIGIGAMALLSDDATLPLPQPLADTPKDVSNDTNNDNPKRPRPNPDKPNPIEEPTRPEPVPVDNSKPDGAYTIQAQKSDKTITGLVIGPDGQPFGGAKVMARPIYNDPDVSWASAWNSDSDEEGANVDPKERRRQYLEMTEAIEAAAQELTSGANGTFSFSDLYDLPYALSVFVEGYTPVSIGNTTVKPGNEVKFALRELRNLVVTVLLPEGGEPKQANVTINGSSNNNNYKMRGGWEYSGISSSLMVEDFGGGGYY